MKHLDATRIFYPRGFLTRIRETKGNESTVKRIELFARDRKETYGIIRNLHVAYSSERSLLDLSQISNSVIYVHSIESNGSGSLEGRKIVEDRLVLKRSDEQNVGSMETGVENGPSVDVFRMKIPDLAVSPHWLERMKLRPGDRLIVSNPIENYAVAPPSVA